MLMTQLFLSFHPSDFQANISHLQNALTQIISWMTSNPLSLNASKTEFLLIGVKRQLSKIHNSSTSIDTTQSARNLGFIFNEHLSFSDQYYSAFVSVWPHIYSASSQSQHTLFTLCYSDQTIIIITQSHSLLLPTCFTLSMEPASNITLDSSSKLFIPLSATIIWTCRFNLLHTAITFHHFFTVSL